METNKNGIEKSRLLQRDCDLRYTPGMEREKVFRTNYVGPDYMDKISTMDTATKSDYFLLRGVLFFRQATARMVADYLIYFRNRYGQEECKNLPMLPVYSHSDEGLEGYWLKIRKRLLKLTKCNLLYCDKYKRNGGNEKSEIYVFTANYYTFSFVNSVFGKDESYNGPYYNAPMHISLRNMHACEVAVEGFMRHTPPVAMGRENTIRYGSKAGIYTPVMHVKMSTGEGTMHVMVEAMHFNMDTSVVTETEYLEDLKKRIMILHDVVRHFDYIQRVFEKKESVRFLIVCENLFKMQQAVKLMDKYRDDFSEKVFFTNATALKACDGNLAKSSIMAKKRESKEGVLYLGLVEPDVKNNRWLLPGE